MSVDSRRAIFCVVLMCAAPVGGCVRVPELQRIAGSTPDPYNTNPKSISINDVILRAKCELRDSIADRVGNDYEWLNKWTAQADLTLALNDQSGIAPGATFTQPLTIANIPQRVTNFAQSASLGVGASATTTAARTEIVSFSISIKEIRDQFKNMSSAELYEMCHPRSLVDLTSDLGLKDWVDSALGPVQNNLLKSGYHKPPKRPAGAGGAAGGASGGAKPQFLGAVEFYRHSLLELYDALGKSEFDGTPFRSDVEIIYDEYLLLREASQLLREIRAGVNNPAQDWKASQFQGELGVFEDVYKEFPMWHSPMTKKQLPSPLDKLSDASVVKSAFDKIGSMPSRAQLTTLQMIVQNKVTDIEKALAKIIPSVIASLQIICDCKAPIDNPSDEPATQKPYSRVFPDALKCLNTILTLVKGDIPPAPPPEDPPIDAISHQVQFILALTASANPTWTLVHFKGPSPSSGSFASLSGTNTHTLTLVIGVPGSEAVVNSRSALTFSTALANQFNPANPALSGTPTISIVP